MPHTSRNYRQEVTCTFLALLLAFVTGCPTTDPDPNPTPTSPSVTFQVPQILSTDAGPEAITSALINGDTYPDIISANRGASSASLWLSTGPNTYATATRLVLSGTEPRAVAVNTLNTDGTTDIIVANAGSDNITVFHADTTGSLSPGRLTALPEGAAPRDVLSADLNNDGIGDVVTANGGLNTVSVLLGSTEKGFTEAAHYLTGAEPRSLAATDVDGDGTLDLVTANRGSDSLTVLINDGTGGFPTTFDIATGKAPHTVVSADLDKDGNQDLIVSSPAESSIAIHRGNGNGGFETVVFLSLEANPTRMVLEDFTGDGNIDILTMLFTNDADTVSSGKLLCLAGDGQGDFERHEEFAVAPGVIALLVDDLNRDGDTDLVLANSSENFVATTLGTGTSLALERRFPVGTRPRMAVAGDFNRDSKVDLLVTNLDSRNVTFLPGDGNGAFGAGTSIAAGGRARFLAVDHLNNDDNLDFVVSNLDESRVAVFTGQGDGTFDTAVYYDVRGDDSARSAEPRSIVIVDINGDSNVDLVVGNANRDSVAILLGAGDGTFGSATEYGVGNFPLSVQVADFDRNGTLDIAVANGVDVNATGSQMSAIHVLPGLGDGTFDTENMVGYVTNTGPGSLIARDLDQDGIVDLATSHNSLNSVQIFSGRDDGSFGSGGVLNMGNNPNAVGLADFNGDGLPDLFATNDSGTLSFRLYGETGGFGIREEVRVGKLPIEALLTDLNGDGYIDIVTPNWGSNDVSVLLGTAGQP